MTQKLFQSAMIVVYVVGYAWYYWKNMLNDAPKRLKRILGVALTIMLSAGGLLLLNDLWGKA